MSGADWSGCGSGRDGQLWDFETCGFLVEQIGTRGGGSNNTDNDTDDTKTKNANTVDNQNSKSKNKSSSSSSSSSGSGSGGDSDGADMFPARAWTMDWLASHCAARFGVTPQPTALVEVGERMIEASSCRPRKENRRRGNV